MTPLTQAPIHFDAADGKRTHAPMVFATVGAIRTRLILDTGSDVHLLTRELAESAGLALAAVDQGTSLMLRTGIGDPPAMIGQDVLRGTVLALGPDASTPVFWQVRSV